ncbi:MAG: VWA domain-containing protein [Desulfurococcales archaeon]|nr:VWA domain-containing protein [Desulfurococcales archaeon]
MEAGVGNPWMLIAGLPLPVLAAYLARRAGSRRRAILFYLEGRASRATAIIGYARVAGIMLAVLAASGVYVVRITWVPASGVGEEVLADLPAIHVLLVDDSKSMKPYVGDVRTFITSYLETLGPEDRVAVYKFHAGVEEVCSPGPPQGCIVNLTMIRGESRYTAIGTALGHAAAMARATGLPIIVLLVSDGANNMGPDPRSVARSLAGDEMAVALVKVGSDPRSVLEDLASEAGWPIYTLGTTPPKGALEDLARDLYTEAKVEAVSVNGMIPLESRDYTPTTLLLLASLILLAGSKVAGP